jgi:hypothetical protein
VIPPRFAYARALAATLAGAVLLAAVPASAALTFSGETSAPRVAFALADLRRACATANPAVADLTVTFTLDPALGAEAYQLTVAGPALFTVTGGDTGGADRAGAAPRPHPHGVGFALSADPRPEDEHPAGCAHPEL